MKKNYFVQTLLLASLFALFSAGALYAQNAPFITVWKSDNVGISGDQEIRVTASGDWDYEWEEVGNPNNNGASASVASDVTTISFGAEGVYRLKIYPNTDNGNPFHRIQFPFGDDNYKIIDIEQWGDVQWSTFEKAFFACDKITGSATDNPNLSQVTNMAQMFNGADNFNGDLSGWDVSEVTNMEQMFSGAEKFNGDISSWNVGKVTNMKSMFFGAYDFNQDLSGWNVSKVTDMSLMFNSANEFNSNIGGWDVSQVTNMAGMFEGSDKFNGDVSSWNVASVKFISWMFSNAKEFNRDLSGWEVGEAVNMQGMFNGATQFNSNIGGWDVSQVTHMKAMFKDATAFNQNIGGWDVSQVASMESMFENAAAFNSSIGGWDVSQVTTMHNMFKNAAEFNRDIGGWDVSQLGVGQNGSDNDISFEGSGLSDENYSRILREWAQNANIGEDVIMDAYGLGYCQDIVQHRDELINLLNWTINGDNEGACILSLNELAVSSFTISPNPAQQEVTIGGLQGKETIQLIDMTGRVLKTINNKGVSSSTLQIDELSEGIYNLVIQKDGQQIVKKVVKR